MTEEDVALLKHATQTVGLIYFDPDARIGKLTKTLLLTMAYAASFKIVRFVCSTDVMIPCWPYKVEREMESEYRDVGGHLPSSKCFLLMAVGDHDEVLLGAF